MSQKAKKRSIPNEIYVVETDSEYRIYTSEGQSTNWALKQKEKGQKGIVHIFVPKEEKTND